MTRSHTCLGKRSWPTIIGTKVCLPRAFYSNSCSQRIRQTEIDLKHACENNLKIATWSKHMSISRYQWNFTSSLEINFSIQKHVFLAFGKGQCCVCVRYECVKLGKFNVYSSICCLKISTICLWLVCHLEFKTFVYLCGRFWKAENFWEM